MTRIEELEAQVARLEERNAVLTAALELAVEHCDNFVIWLPTARAALDALEEKR